MFRALVLLGIWSNVVLAAPLEEATAQFDNVTAFALPTVQLDNAIVTGKASGRVSEFLGIPFAKPPIGDLRFRLPQPHSTYALSFPATEFGLACPQQAINLPPILKAASFPSEAKNFLLNFAYGKVVPDSEDCLTINVVKPASATPTSKLPVIVWIFGGGFEIGSPNSYDGSVIVKRSMDLNHPSIYVSMNYRLTGFGFLGGKEVKAAGVGNLGLHDQREALRWIQKYIGAFGGDPSKVTIWGESAGAISVSLQMLANNGNHEGLFRAGFMQSGAPVPVGDITFGQKYYDAIVSETGCSGAPDTLECLRTVKYKDLKTAINNSPGIFSYQSLSLAWLPRPDGVFLTDHPQKLVKQGKVANVPFITGSCDDEGTFFSLSTLNITTTPQLKTYLKTVFLGPGVPDADIDKILELYPRTATLGSPFDTGLLNAISLQYKRIAAFMGDGVFQAPRRFFLNERSGKQPTWAFLSKRFKVLPVLGSMHGSDILNVFNPVGGGMADYLVRFAANLDPNPPTGLQWPRYTTTSRKLLTFKSGLIQGFYEEISEDNYRTEQMAFLTNVTLEHPI